MSIRKLTNALYPSIEGVYDDIDDLYYPNYYDDAELLAITGWSKSSAFTKSQIRLEGDGQLVFFTDDNTPELNWLVYEAGTVFTEPAKVQLKEYLNKDPELTFLGKTTYGKDEMTDNGDGTYYIDAPYSIDVGQVYAQTGLTERWYFPENGPFDTSYPQSINFTDADTGLSVSDNYSITYVESSISNKPWATSSTMAFVFDDSVSPLDDYIDSGRSFTATPTVGPDYPGTLVTKGNKVTIQNHMNILNSEVGGGDDDKWTGKHLCYPYSNQKCAGRTSYNIDNSGGNGFFDLQGDWSIEYDVVRTGPQSQAEYDDSVGVNTYQHVLQATDVAGQIVNDSVVDLYHYEYGYEASNAQPSVVVDGTYCTMPIKGVEPIRNFKIFVTYHYNSTLDQGEVDVMYYHKYKNDWLMAVQTIIPTPPARTAVEDITVNGGNFGTFEQASHVGLGGFVYYDGVIIDPVNDEWMHSNCYYFASTLNLGDSWTKTHNLDLNTQGYTNRLLQRMHDDSIGRHKAFFARYAPDYHYTCPPGTAVPAWSDDYGHIPSVGDPDDIIAMLDDRLIPNKIMLSYTGINHALIFYTAKQGNPAWGSVQWSAPVYYALETIQAIDARNIPWLTWDSCPSDVVLDTTPAPQEDLILRHEDPTYSWYDLVSATKTMNTYDVTNDPANNGDILPSIALGDGAHITEAGYILLGDYIYNNHASILP